MSRALNSLAVRAGLAVAAVFVAFIGIGFVVVDRAEAAVVDVERPRLQAAAAQLADAVSYGVLAHSAALLEAPLAAFQQSPDLTSVVVLDDHGAVLVEHRGLHRSNDAAGDAADDAPDVEVEAAVVTRGSAPGDDGDLAAFGIGGGGAERTGTVRVAWSLSGVREVQGRLRRAIVGAVAGIGLVALLLAGALASGLVRRVQTLAAAARRVSGGDLKTTVDVVGDDELAQLGRDFNAMTASLVVQQQRLHEQGQVLAERESLAALGRATAVIAHELRNPLGIVLAAAGIVKNEDKPMSARAEAAGLIDDEVRRLERTLADLLAYARPRTPQATSVDLVACVNDVKVRVTRSGGPAESCAVEVVVVGASVAVVADDAFVQQILWNLVQNAAQAGARKIDLTVEGNSVRVDDDGPGVAPAQREQLFQPFSTTKQRGTGLGLTASRRMAQDMGGDLRFVVDIDGAGAERGARFVLTLPQQPTDREGAL